MKSKKAKKVLGKAVVVFCNKAPIGFSAAGGTVRVLAGCGARHFGIPFVAAVRAINKVVESLPGFRPGAFFEMPGDARGFERFLSRNY